jgi:microcystin-dependent protein
MTDTKKVKKEKNLSETLESDVIAANVFLESENSPATELTVTRRDLENPLVQIRMMGAGSDYQGVLAISTTGLKGGTLVERMRIHTNGNVGIGTPEPAEKLEVSGTVKAASFMGDGIMLKGMIVMWSGAINAIPNGWALCDGNKGTPDLRNRFIAGAGDKYKPGDYGGVDTVTLNVKQIPAHDHDGNTESGGQHEHLTEGQDAYGLAWRKRTYPGDTTVKMGYGGGRGGDPNNEMWRGHAHTDFEGQHAHHFRTGLNGGSDAHENRPPYYALAYIMKL